MLERSSPSQVKTLQHYSVQHYRNTDSGTWPSFSRAKQNSREWGKSLPSSAKVSRTALRHRLLERRRRARASFSSGDEGLACPSQAATKNGDKEAATARKK